VSVSASPRTVTYVALGRHRVRAAVEHTARLAAGGADVQLVVAERPDTADLAVAPAVAVHRVGGPGGSAAAAAAATRLVTDAKGPLPVPDLMIAGDVEALPVAWAAHRRHRGLTVRFEPNAEPRRRPAPADLAVVTPWYPSANDPFAGSFVQSAVQTVDDAFERVSVLHTQEWGFPHGSARGSERLRLIADRVAARWGNVAVEDRPEGELTRVCVPVNTRGSAYSTRATAHVRALAAALPTGQIEAPLIHAHTGVYGGVVAAELARPDARIVVTEHSSFLPRVFADRASRRRYEQMLARVDLVLCVSRHLHDFILEWFPQYHDKLRHVPNVVDFDAFPLRPQPPADLLRWIYVGRLMEQKGIWVLLEAFRRVAGEEAGATLTLVGSGPLAGDIRRRVREFGLAGRVDLRPPVAPGGVAALMHEHDVLVHASRGETFGLTIVEAAATGTPVLVARSQGPAETLAGLEGIAGQTFDISEDPDVIVAAYRDLRQGLGLLDPARARQVLVSRYGRDTVRAHLLAAYRAGAAPSAAGAAAAAATAQASPAERTAAAGTGPAVYARPDGARLVLIAIGPGRPTALASFTQAVSARGYQVDVLTADATMAKRVGGNGKVRVHSVEAAERRGLLLSIERLLLFKVPGKAIAMAMALARRRSVLWPELAVLRLQRFHRRVAGAVDRRLFKPCYDVVRPLIMWRIVRRHVLPKLELEKTSRVVISHNSGVTAGWRLARRHPHLTVTTSMSTSFDD
jgi:glycosyltransferase involved in cell wall biosynthesis